MAVIIQQIKRDSVATIVNFPTIEIDYSEYLLPRAM
jgi:hypothetical protein